MAAKKDPTPSWTLSFGLLQIPVKAAATTAAESYATVTDIQSAKRGRRAKAS